MIDKEFSVAPVLETRRFALWRPQAGDLQPLCDLLADDETRRYLGPGRAGLQNKFERLTRNAGSWALYGYGTFVVRPRGGAEVIGSCGIFHSWRGFGKGLDNVPEAGWIVRRDWWGQGAAREIMAAALDWFDREHGALRIACMIEVGNTASERVAAALGFVDYDEHLLADGADEAPSAILRLLERLP